MVLLFLSILLSTNFTCDQIYCTLTLLSKSELIYFLLFCLSVNSFSKEIISQIRHNFFPIYNSLDFFYLVFSVLLKKVYLLIVYLSLMQLLEGLVKHTSVLVTCRYDGVLFELSHKLSNSRCYVNTSVNFILLLMFCFGLTFYSINSIYLLNSRFLLVPSIYQPVTKIFFQ